MAHRGVLKPPGIAARGLARWAGDLWHFVNGKALYGGLNLLEMEFSDMLDVIQFFMEEEMIRQSSGQADVPGAVRSYLYKELYGEKYLYYTPAGGRTHEGLEDLDDPLDGVTPLDPKIEGTKAYVPPTRVDADAANPFGDILDAPLG